MAIRGLSHSEEEIFITRDDSDRVYDKDGNLDVDASIRAGATGFVLKNIPNSIMMRIMDMTQFMEQEYGSNRQRIVNQLAQKNREAFKYGIDHFINFSDGKVEIVAEKEKTFENGRTIERLTEATMDKILGSIVSEVGNKIIEKNTLSETQAKNFEALLSQLGASDTSSAPSAMTETDSEEGTEKTGQSEVQTESP